MQRSRSRKLARLERQTDLQPDKQRLAKLLRHASIGAAVVAAISAARAQQPDSMSLMAAVAQSQANATAAAATPAPSSTAGADQSGLQEVIVTATKQAENIQSIPV